MFRSLSLFRRFNDSESLPRQLSVLLQIGDTKWIVSEARQSQRNFALAKEAKFTEVLFIWGKQGNRRATKVDYL